MSRLTAGEPTVEKVPEVFQQAEVLAISNVSDSLTSASISSANPETSHLADAFNLVMTDGYSYSPWTNVLPTINQFSSVLPLPVGIPLQHRNMLKARNSHRSRSEKIYAFMETIPIRTQYRNCLDVSRFIQAVSLNNTDRVREMIRKGISPNTTEGFNRSALHIACSRGYLDTIKVLLENGANPNIRDRNLNTPLHLATCTENIEVVQTLIDYGTNVLLKDSKGHLALEIAISKLRLSERTRSMMRKESRIQIITVCERIFAAFREQRCNPLLCAIAGHDSEDMFQKFSTQLEQVRRKQLEIDIGDPVDSIVDQMTNLQLKIEIDNEVDSLLSTLHQFSLK